MTSSTTNGHGRMATLALFTIIGAGLSAVALAQNAEPASSTPEDVNASSAAAMKDTVRDPRIAISTGHWGIWDIGRPHVKMQGAFDDHDPIGIAAGKLIPADCSFNWTDADTHQVFCFSSQASLVYFLSAPKANTARAEKRWRDLKRIPTG